jgi:hypothetical protein
VDGPGHSRKNVPHQQLEQERAGFLTSELPYQKAVLKTRAVQTLRDGWASSNCAKRLECPPSAVLLRRTGGALTAAFNHTHGSIVRVWSKIFSRARNGSN